MLYCKFTPYNYGKQCFSKLTHLPGIVGIILLTVCRRPKQAGITFYASVNESQLCLIKYNFLFPGRFDISHRKYQCLGCLEVLSTSDPAVLTQSGFWPGSISDTTYVFDQDLLLLWDILQKQIPGISERSFLKSLELYSKQKGRVSVAFLPPVIN